MLQWRNVRFARTVQLNINPLEHRGEVGSDLGIPESQHAISLVLEPELSLAIAFGGLIVIVMSAIELDDESLGRTEKINHITPDGRLSAEVSAFQRKLFESPS